MPTTKKRLVLLMEPCLKSRIEAKAEKSGVSSSALVSMIVTNYFDQQDKMEPMLQALVKQMGESLGPTVQDALKQGKF